MVKSSNPLPTGAQRHLDLLAAKPQAVQEQVASARRLGGRYAAEVWREHRPVVLQSYRTAVALLETIPDERNRAAACQYLVARLPKGFVSEEEAAYFSPPAADLSPLEVPDE